MGALIRYATRDYNDGGSPSRLPTGEEGARQTGFGDRLPRGPRRVGRTYRLRPPRVRDAAIVPVAPGVAVAARAQPTTGESRCHRRPFVGQVYLLNRNPHLVF
ncbi:hypothetical protein EVAR_64561_1 [Eumeta japonica]|uniref:Uncharacterized protein n=1 Tax=Eumeta variegata TaxID=151549 RepID=A0A4C1ZCV5_EUMVA|nr:hypothetical protein EVAR_64561_1 [Eumeta japonica]